MKIVWSRRAVVDLKHLRAYIAHDDPRAAAKLARLILDAADRLAEFPAMGRAGRVPGTRELILAGTPFILPYTLAEGRIVIVAVMHASRQWPDDL